MKDKRTVDFDYAKAVAELEEIAAKVEDASTSIDDVDRYIKRTKEHNTSYGEKEKVPDALRNGPLPGSIPGEN